MNCLSFVNDFFHLGHHVTQLPVELRNQFWDAIKQTEWKDGSDKYGLKFCPNSESDIYNQLSLQVSQLPAFDVLKMLKSNIVPMRNYIWNGAEDIPWHSDSIRGADLTVFCYFTDRPWKSEWGGTVKFCKYVNGTEINVSDEILPNDGTIVIFDNINPLHLHTVNKLKTNVDRFVFTFTYKWLY